MEKTRGTVTLLVCISVLFFMTSFVFADDTTADDWITSSGNTYVTSGNVGIGTTSPQAELNVNGDILIQNAGYIGSASDTDSIQIEADGDVVLRRDLYIGYGLNPSRLSMGQQSGSGDIHIGSSGMPNPASGTQDYGFYTAYNGYRASDGSWYHSRTSTVDALKFTGVSNIATGTGGFLWEYTTNDGAGAISWNTLMRLNVSGNLGIGTMEPSFKLDVSDDSSTLGRFSRSSSGIGALRISVQDGEQAILQMGDVSDGDVQRIISDNSDNSLAFYTGNSEQVRIANTGNVGIGTTSPKKTLHVDGDYYGKGHIWLHAFEGDCSSGTAYLQARDNSGTTDIELQLRTQSAGSIVNALRIDNTGNVGIGTTSPNNKLDVKGIIRAEEVKVETGWSDFVFEDNYNLPPLDHVESYIKENKHLPDIPSAKEVKEQGLSVSEMMAKQMQKIEELTLYVIEQNKKMEALISKNSELEKRLATMEMEK